jgi:hypothetical protein
VLVAELRRAGASIDSVDETPIELEAFGQNDQRATLVRQFGDTILLADLVFGNQVQQADHDQARERLDTMVSIALVRYASGQATDLTTPTPRAAPGPDSTISPDVTVIVN